MTLRSIAAEVGVTPALVAHYAPSMDVLVAHTFAAVVGSELAEMAQLVAEQPEALKRLASLLETLLDGSRDDVTLVWVQSFTLGANNQVLAERVRAEMNGWQRLIQSIIESGVSESVFTAADPHAVAWQILGMLDGLNAQSLVNWRETASRMSLMARSVEAMLGLPARSLGHP